MSLIVGPAKRRRPPCLWPGCTRRPRRGVLMCRHHWACLTPRMRRQLAAAEQPPGGDTPESSAAFYAAVDVAYAYALSPCQHN